MSAMILPKIIKIC